MNEQEFAELSAGHALNALSPDDERAYHDALLTHPEWIEITQLDEATVAMLSEGVAPVAPPADLRSRLLSAVADPAPAPVEDVHDTAAAVAAPSTEVVQAVQRRNWSRGLFALVASMALLVGVGWGVGSISQLWQTPPAVTALEQIEAAPDASSAAADFGDGMATVHWSEELGQVVLVADGLPSIPDDRTFELWYVRGDTAIPAGTFDASSGSSTALLDGTMQPGDTIAVTVEQDGGSPEGVPTTDPILAVSTA